MLKTKPDRIAEMEGGNDESALTNNIIAAPKPIYKPASIALINTIILSYVIL
jgi:hypothetical protein